MARAAEGEGALPAKLLIQARAFGRAPSRLSHRAPAHPSLLHGDLWTGNVLVRGDRVAGFVDPGESITGHPEIELAFTTLFGTFGATFFETYGKLCAARIREFHAIFGAHCTNFTRRSCMCGCSALRISRRSSQTLSRVGL